MEAITKEEIRQIAKEYEMNKEKVVEFLLKNITHVDLEIPKVVKGVFGEE
jgi:hypothetical protein